MDRLSTLVDRCIAEYDERGWVGGTWLDGGA